MFHTGVQIAHSIGKAILAERGSHVKYRNTAVTCVKTAELIVMLFGLWAQSDPRNHELDGVQIAHEKGQFWGKGHPL